MKRLNTMKKTLILWLLCLCMIGVKAQEKKTKKVQSKDEKQFADTRGGDVFSSDTIKVKYLDIKVSKEDIPNADVSFDLEAQSTRNFALLVGVSDYRFEGGGIQDLTKPVLDAEGLQQILKEVYAFDSTDIILLKNATKAEMIRALSFLADSIGESDNLLIYYAGHGVFDSYTQSGSWQLADAKPNDKYSWFGNEELKGYIGRIKSKHTLLIADACFSGSLFRANKDVMEDVNTPENIKAVYSKKSRKAMTSATSSTVALDQSVFMQYLMKYLKENQDDFLSADELFGKVKKETIKHIGSKQIPQYGEININNFQDNDGGDFVFIKKNVLKK